MSRRDDYYQSREIIKKVVGLKKTGDLQEAENLLIKYLDKFPRNRYLKASLADLFVRTNRLEEGVNLADEVLGEKPDDFRALMVRGEAALKENDLEAARDFFQQSYESRPEHFTATRLIRTYMKTGDLEQALSICQEWLEAEPDNTYFKKLRASIYEKMGKTDEAQKTYLEYLEEKPEDQFAYKEAIKLKIKDKSPAQAVRELRQLLKVGGRQDNAHLRTLLAGQLEKQEKYDEAVEEYKKALELEPGNAFALKQMGFCLVRAGRGEEALPHLEEGFRQDPGDFYVRSSLLSLYRKLGREGDGAKFFREVIQANPAFKKLWSFVRKLEKEAGE